MMVYYLVLLYAAGVVTAAYRKAATKEMELHSKYELRVSESIETLSAKMNKFIKEIIKTFVKEKKKSEKKNEEIIESELLDDFSVMETEKRGEKILIVYEIHNTYLEEINRYKQKKENS
jgi:uncharacterized membrane-anchored protein